MKTAGTFSDELGLNFSLKVINGRVRNFKSSIVPSRLSSNDGSVVLKSTMLGGNLLAAIIPVTRFYWMAIVCHDDSSSVPVLSYRVGDPGSLISELNEVSSWKVVGGNHIAESFGFTKLIRGAESRKAAKA